MAVTPQRTATRHELSHVLLDARAAHVAARQRARLEAIAVELTRHSADRLPQAVVAQAIRLFGADAAALAVPTEQGEMELLAASGLADALVTERRFLPRDDEAPLAAAVRLRRAVFGTTADLLTPPRRRTGGSSAVVPLLRRDEALGALGLAFADGRRLSDDERRLLAGLANVCGNVLDQAYRARLYERSRRLRSLTEALVRATSVDDAAAAVLRQGTAALRATGGAIMILSPDGTRLELLASAGYTPELQERFRDLPLDADVPLALAAAGDREILVESRRENDRLYEGLLGIEAPARTALVALPLRVDDRILGSIGFTFGAGRIFDYEDRAFSRAVSELCVQAIDRAQRTRLQTRTARLQSLLSALWSATTRDEVAEALVRTAVQAFGASAAVFALPAADGVGLEVVAAAGAGARAPRSLEVDAVDPLADAVKTGSTVLLQSRDDMADRYPPGGVVLALPGDEAVAAVPLSTDDACVGAFGFAYVRPRTFTREERTFLAAVGDLCLQALDRARLSENLQDSQKLLHRVLERLDEGVIAVDGDLRVAFANRNAVELLGEPALSVGRPLPDPWHGLSLPAFVRSLLDGDSGGPQARVELESGAILELVAVPDEDSAVVILRDVTRRERQERAEREFVSNAAHELRTPLAGIASAVEALRMGAVDDPVGRERFLAGMTEAILRLTKLVNALLILARAQRDPSSMTLERVAVAPLLARVAAGLEVRPGVRIAVDCPAGIAVLGEQTLVEAVLRNLAQNASRETESGRIAFTCRSAPGERVEIEVRDTGHGIPPHAKERVFERFYRADTSDDDGFGLGLPLVREMVRALGGDVRLESQLRVGTAVRVLLPEAR